jgi:hypothetical protein
LRTLKGIRAVDCEQQNYIALLQSACRISLG